MIDYQGTGVIFLAAGKSTRFMETSNVPKALYPVAQMTWLEYSMRSFDSLDQVIITGAFHDLFTQTLPQLKDKLILNEDYEFGVFSSVLTGLHFFTDKKQVLIMPVDNGIVDKNTIEILLGQDDTYDIIVPLYEGQGGHPVLLRKNFIEQLLKMDKQTGRLDFAIRDYQQDKVLRPECFDKNICVNLNTENQLLTYMDVLNATNLRIDHIGNQAGALSLIEIGLGSFLHGLKIPFSGQFLSLNQGFFLTRTATPVSYTHLRAHETVLSRMPSSA